MFCPLISFIMNGFLYARSKILIVFIPLIILQAGLVLEDFTFRINYSMLILIILPLFLSLNLILYVLIYSSA